MLIQLSRPIGVDLFCGAGGMSLGFEQVGFDIAVAVDHDPFHTRTHQRNFPACRTLMINVSELSSDDIYKAIGIDRKDIDVVVGGPPCQGFSSIGKRQMDDPRNLLLGEFARIVEELQPNYWVMENVKGLMMGKIKPIMDSFIDRLKMAGYAVVEPIQLLNAKDFGVPQIRKRVFIIGYKPHLPAPSYPEIDSTAHSENKTSCPTVWDAISDLEVLDSYAELVREDTYCGELGIGSHYSKILRGEIDDPDDHSIKRNVSSKTLTGCRRSKHTEKIVERFKNTIPGSYESISRFYRLTKEGVSNALRAGTVTSHGGHTAPRPIHPVKNRCITVREAARLHSFPDWFQFDPTIWHGFRQVGNSVPPLLARAIGTSIMSAIKEVSSSGLESIGSTIS